MTSTALQECVDDWRNIDVPRILRGEYQTVPNPGDPPDRLASDTSVAALNEIVCEYYGIGPRTFARDRLRHVVYARWMCWRILRDATSLNLSEIASYYGKDHSTIIYGLARFADLLRRDPKFGADMRDLRRAWEAADV